MSTERNETHVEVPDTPGLREILEQAIPVDDSDPCRARGQAPFYCTRSMGHDGPHAFHGKFGVVALWERQK